MYLLSRSRETKKPRAFDSMIEEFDGRLWLVTTHKQLAEMIGCMSPSQVKRCLEKLRKKKLIVCKTRQQHDGRIRTFIDLECRMLQARVELFNKLQNTADYRAAVERDRRRPRGGLNMEMDIAQLTQIRERLRKIDKLWETNRIKFIINQLGLKRQFQAIKDRYHENTGGKGWYATFKLFADILPLFPMVFSTNRLKDDRWQVDPFMPLCGWFNNYNDTPITRAYEEVYEQLSSECNGRLIGMLFPLKMFPKAW